LLLFKRGELFARAIGRAIVNYNYLFGDVYGLHAANYLGNRC
jgi:hypothetical protein